MNNLTYNNIKGKSLWMDIYFIFIINIFPILQTVGYLPPIVIKMGINFTSLILIIPLFIYSYWKSIKKLYKEPFYIVTCITIIYISYTFLRSCVNQGLMLSFINFRYSFCNIFVFLFACHYIYSLPTQRVYNIIKLLFLFTIIQSIFFSGHVIGIFNFYNGNSVTIYNTSLTRSYMGFPPLVTHFLGASFILYLSTKRNKFLVYTIILIFTIFFSYTRSSLAVSILLLILITITLCIRNCISISNILRLFLFISSIIISLYIFAPSSMSYWTDKINNTVNNELVEEEGTYAFREKLINEAIYQNRHGSELYGLGYKRDSEKGEYSIVQGEDTFIAPIIFCEGYIGLFLRILIILTILASNIIRSNISSNRINLYINTLILSIIFSEIPNYVQTTTFVKFTITPLFIVLISRLYIKKTFKLK